MPSGAKKRKAARKKKESQSVDNHSNEDHEVKHQDDRDSDVSSQTSQDNNSHQYHSSEGDEEQNEKEENNSRTPAEEVFKTKDSDEPSNVVKDDVVPVDREFEIEDKSSQKVGGSSSGSSSGSHSSHSNRSGSDDESHDIKKGEAAIDTAPVADLGNGNEYLSGVPAENIVNDEIDDGIDSVAIPAEESKNTSTVVDGVGADISIAPSIIPMESEEEKLSFVDDNGVTSVFMDVPSKRKEESIENNVNPDPKERVTQEIHDGVATDIGVEVGKDSGVTEVLLVRGPRPVQATTWKSCCGLFDVFSGSGR